jgi:NADH:ubiquinone oxidoreductase subunit K
VSSIPTAHFLYLAALLFGFGLFAALARKNAISVLMGIELMLNGVNINFLAFARHLGPDNMAGGVFVVFVITLAAAEAAVALAIIIAIYRQMRGVNVDEVKFLKG